MKFTQDGFYFCQSEKRALLLTDGKSVEDDPLAPTPFTPDWPSEFALDLLDHATDMERYWGDKLPEDPSTIRAETRANQIWASSVRQLMTEYILA